MVDIRTEQHRLRWSRLVAAPLGVVALVSLAACGSGTGTSAASDGSTPTSTATAAADAAGAGDSTMAAFRTCMEQNGVTLPQRRSGSGGGGNGGAPGDAGGTPPSGAPTAPPDGSGGGSGHGRGRTPDQAPPGVDATKWAAARQACASPAPTPPGGAAPSASAGS